MIQPPTLFKFENLNHSRLIVTLLLELLCPSIVLVELFVEELLDRIEFTVIVIIILLQASINETPNIENTTGAQADFKNFLLLFTQLLILPNLI